MACNIRRIASSTGFAALISVGIFAHQLHAATRPDQVGLSYVEAQNRSSHVSDVNYHLQISLRPELPDYTGQVISSFQYHGTKDALTIDFEGGKVEQLVINKKVQESINYNGHFITLPGGSLLEGENEVKIQFKRDFSPASRGLYRFKDPEDGRIYMYTDFEPYFANEFFPCFDQPDLKARLTLTVTAPTDWQVISTTLEEHKKPDGKGYSTVMFPETPTMSTYLYSLHAGPYHVWKDPKHYSVPMRLFARESLAKYVDPTIWFTVTRQGLDFYGDYFNYRYAFKKYDQIIVPDFNAGAMENIAAITFSERYINRGKMTRDDKVELASVILHEMAHQWFGDLVTMKWWGDLWLNESFATFMEAKSLYEATEFKESWVDFAAWAKRGAYFEDQLVTTHPISANVDDTENAMNSFDGITYGKGASSLKQLAYAAGPEAFRDGVRNYLKKYQYGNANLADFLASIQEKAPKFDSARWSREWLATAGLNSVQPTLKCEQGKIKELVLHQAVVSGEKVLRQHTTNVALFDKKGGKMALRKAVRVTYDGETTNVPNFNGQACPAFIYPNYDDQDYAAVVLTESDLKAALTHVTGFPNAELRIGLWQTFSQMVRDGQLNIESFFDTIIAKIPSDRDQKVKALALSTLDLHTGFLNYLPTPGQAGSKYESYIQRFEKMLWTEFTRAKGGSDDQMLWFDNYARIVESKDGLTKFAKLLNEEKSIPKGFVLDQDRKWTIVKALARQSFPDTVKFLSAQEKNDPTNSGKLAALTAKASSANEQDKRNYWNEIIDLKTTRSEAELKAMMRDFFPRTRPDLRRSYAKDYYGILSGDLSKVDRDWLRTFTGAMKPLTCTAEDLTVMKNFLAANLEKLPPAASKSLRISVQEDERCIAGRH